MCPHGQLGFNSAGPAPTQLSAPLQSADLRDCGRMTVRLGGAHDSTRVHQRCRASGAHPTFHPAPSGAPRALPPATLYLSLCAQLPSLPPTAASPPTLPPRVAPNPRPLSPILFLPPAGCCSCSSAPHHLDLLFFFLPQVRNLLLPRINYFLAAAPPTSIVHKKMYFVKKIGMQAETR